MSSITTGRPLDDDGEPRGPGLELDPDGPSAELLADAERALASGPGTGMWAVLLDDPLTVDRPEMVVWLAPDSTEFPPHVHESAPETFAVLEGELAVSVDGDERAVPAGESITVAPGEEHGFRNATDGVVAFRVELPWGKTATTQYTFFGRDHEGAFGADGEFGEPGPLHALVMTEAISEETRVTAAPLAIQRVLWATLGRVATALGREAVERRFLEDEFWEAHVEQPNL